MKFKPGYRIEAFADTGRKRAAFHRKMRDQQERMPLLAELIREQQPEVDDEMARRAVTWLDQQQEMRDRRAAGWRKARARLFGLGDNMRSVVRSLWREAPYPADPGYLLDLLHRIDVGTVDIDNPPWRFSTEEEIAAGRAKLANFVSRPTP